MQDYPNKPPVVKFVSKLFHPNVYADGAICLDILQNQWSPIYDIAAILTSIQVRSLPRRPLSLCASSQLKILGVGSVAAERPQPELAGERGGRAAVAGEPARVRQESEGGGRGELGIMTSIRAVRNKM